MLALPLSIVLCEPIPAPPSFAPSPSQQRHHHALLLRWVKGRARSLPAEVPDGPKPSRRARPSLFCHGAV